jgi:hypothetical protein
VIAIDSASTFEDGRDDFTTWKRPVRIGGMA